MPAEEDEFGRRPLTKALLQKVLRERNHYATPVCNTALYLHDLRLRSLGGGKLLVDFTALRVLNLSNNGLSQLEGLGGMQQLQVLQLQSNTLHSLDGLASLSHLQTLNVSSNPLGAATGGCGLRCGDLPPSVRTLQVASCGLAGPGCVAGLLELPALEVLDLSANEPLKGLPLLEALCRLATLRVLYVMGSGLAATPNLRRILISGLPRLSFLDTSPVDECERRGAEAWLLGGELACCALASGRMRACICAHALLWGGRVRRND